MENVFIFINVLYFSFSCLLKKVSPAFPGRILSEIEHFLWSYHRTINMHEYMYPFIMHVYIICMYRWVDRWMNGCMHACIDAWMHGWTDGWMDRLDTWMNWVNRMLESIDGSMDRSVHVT